MQTMQTMVIVVNQIYKKREMESKQSDQTIYHLKP
jgi:hypothetical protein